MEGGEKHRVIFILHATLTMLHQLLFLLSSFSKQKLLQLAA